MPRMRTQAKKGEEIMGFFKALFGTPKTTTTGKRAYNDGHMIDRKDGRHCGVCGFELELSDTLCPACGGDPISADEDDEEEMDGEENLRDMDYEDMEDMLEDEEW